MRKRLVATILIGAMAFSLTACGAAKSSNVEPAPEVTEETAAAEPEVIDETETATADAPTDTPYATPTEASDEALAEAAKLAAPDIDITGCDTFTQIVDQKLADGMGYANETIGDTDVLLVSSGTYDNMDGNMAAIDAAIFAYAPDGSIMEIGKVCSGGTAYPLCIKDGVLLTGSNHWGCEYTIENNELKIVEKASVEYDLDGKETYFYESGDGTDKDAELAFEAFYGEYEGATVVNFQPVGGVTSAEVEEAADKDASANGAENGLPKYEYPGPELFYSVLYQYIIDECAKNYEVEPGMVTIPNINIIAEDDSNKDDMKVYGDFWVFNYTLNGETLEMQSGGQYPGCVHIKSTDTGYEVTSMDIVGDGDDYNPTAKKIFGDYYDQFMNIDKDAEEATRAQIIANYVAANNLKITAYQDYGWDPVTLPEENIDSFYSILD